MKSGSGTRIFGLDMPNIFPKAQYEKALEVVNKYKDKKKRAWEEFVGGWKAIVYRLKACEEYHLNFTRSINTASTTPQMLSERYFQDKCLYEFFVSGISVLESYGYSLHAVGSICDEKSFKLDNKILRQLNIEKVAESFNKLGSNNIYLGLKRLLNSGSYQSWKICRNVLLHRIAPGRRLYSNNEIVRWKLRNIVLNSLTTSTRFRWLVGQISNLLKNAMGFIENSL